MLDATQIEQFVEQGYVCLDAAFSQEVAATCRELLWRDIPARADDPMTWTKPVVWLGGYHAPPFREAAQSPRVTAAVDQLVGPERWVPLQGLGTFPVRFPAQADTGDTGWHLDASFADPDGDPNDFLSWRVNVNSKGRALLALFLFSDIGERDAPTRIRAGSHRIVAGQLAPHGERGLAIKDVDYSASAGCPEMHVTGAAGTVYLCHPFLVHAAQVNRGTAPRFLAQPPIFPKRALDVLSPPSAPSSELFPLERAIRQALG